MRGRVILYVLVAAAVLLTGCQAAPMTRVTGAAAAHVRLFQPGGTGGAPRVRHRKIPKPAHWTKVTARFSKTASQASAISAPPAGIRLAAFTAPAVAPPSPPFTECPAVGADTSCEILIQVTDSGNSIFADPGQGPFDADDDTMVGVVNNSSEPVSSLDIASDTIAFGFDGDGICSGDYTPEPSGCPFGPTGDEGPGTSFAHISPDEASGAVDFAAPLAPGQTAYFSLEEALSATSVVAGGPSASQAGGAPNPALEDTSCDNGAPVNCATGEFWHTFTDFSVPGRGVPLNLTRTYVSAAAGTDGPFGFGWSDSYGMSLSTDAAGDVTVTQEDGSTLTFTPNGGAAA